ncbi:MAG: hypothetical protein JXA54_06290, partial [Candidatus Heimdallarchaeota archaeon]|nr:hypothetical protein [Candidatus Heimdallarchaeota archaeon]
LDYQYDKLGSSMTGFTLGPNFIVDPYLGRKIGLSVGVVLGIIGITSLTVFLSLHLKKRRKGKLLNNPPNSI